ncbi:MAG TPA: hypothetical protein VGG72_19835 [Bryobacteraceae bacterium]|jgi:hypothetical protein
MPTLPQIIAANPTTTDEFADIVGLLRQIGTLTVTPTVSEVEAFFTEAQARAIRYSPAAISAAKAAALDEIVGPGFVGGFLHRNAPLKFVNFARTTIATQLIVRVIRPTLLGQGDHPLCGPHVVVQDMAERAPLAYALYVIGLAEDGAGDITVNARSTKTVQVDKHSNILDKHDHVGNASRIKQADYIALASLRNDASWLPYRCALTNRTLQGATGSGQVAEWLKQAGYQDVRDKTFQTLSRMAMITKPAVVRDALYRGPMQDSLTAARNFLSLGYSVILCGTGNLANFTLGLDTDDSAVMLMFGGHWMRAKEIAVKTDGIDLKICTWTLGNLVKTAIPWSKVESWYRGFICGDPN